MFYVLEKDKSCNSQFVKREYIPVEILFNDTELVKHLGFYYNDTDLLEFCVDYDNGYLCKFILSFCSHYSFINDDIEIPEAEPGRIKLNYPSHNDCDMFSVSVYNDGIYIKISKAPVKSFISSGQLIIGIDGNNDVAEVYIYDLSSDEAGFVKNELTLG
ncbi:MAG: hypothetical protein HUJ57_03220 [Erysipelotrichaceae bacterium]|nr:hypothetical protein [Erysipelotrichaceae bacterium]